MNKGVTGIQKKDNQNTWGKHKIHGNDQLFMVLLQYTYETLCTCLKYSSYFQIWITTIPLFNYLVSKCINIYIFSVTHLEIYTNKSHSKVTQVSIGMYDITANQYRYNCQSIQYRLLHTWVRGTGAAHSMIILLVSHYCLCWRPLHSPSHFKMRVHFGIVCSYQYHNSVYAVAIYNTVRTFKLDAALRETTLASFKFFC